MKKVLIKGAIVLILLFLLGPKVTAAQTASFSNQQSEYQRIKETWQETREEMRTKKEQMTKEERERNLRIAKTVIEKAIDRAINKLQTIRQRLEKIKVITDERKTKLVADLNTQIAALETLKTQLAATATKEEVKNIAAKSKNKFIEVREIIKKIVTEILLSHLDRVMDKLNLLVLKLETEISALQAKEQDVSGLQKTLTEVKSLMEQAKEKNKAGDWQGNRRLVEEIRVKLAKLVGEIKAIQARLKGETNVSE